MSLSRFNETLHSIRQRLLQPAEPVQAERPARPPRPYPDLTSAQRAFRKTRLAKADEIMRALKARRR
ncbi:MAG: hypothetical protein ACT6Q7_02755 [Blastomonas fulva]|uniref:hypothetical protein n=1 Tax=Blastomonas fulva TaxID=1550728 RepID=UPI004034EC3C